MKILIDTDWFEAIKDLSVEKQQEVLNAILSYPNGNSDTNIWKKVIFPALEKGRIGYFNKISKLKQFNPKKTTTDTVTDTVVDTVSDTGTRTTRREDNINNTRKENNNISTTRAHNALEIFGNAFKATDAVVGVFDKPDGTTHEGIRIKNPHLMAFIKHRFDKKVLSKASDWAIDHNQRGHTYNATSLLKLLCKFQTNVEPTINFNTVQAEYLTFEQKQQKK